MNDALYNVEPLTPREHEVMECLYRGLPTQDAADELGVSLNTLKFHLRNIYSKLGVGSRARAVIVHRHATARLEGANFINSSLQ